MVISGSTHFASKMFRMRNVLIAMFLSIACIAWGQNKPASEEFIHLSGAELQRDLDSLSSWILATHPAPFAYCSENDWLEKLKQNRETLQDGGNLFTAAKVFADLTNLLHDSHTGISLQSFANRLARSNGQIGIEVATVENQTVVVHDWYHTIAPGTIIAAIEEANARSLLGMALSLVPQEGHAMVSQLRMADRLWNDLVPFALGAVEGDSLKVAHASEDNWIFKLEVHPKSELDSIKALVKKPAISWQRLPDHPDVIKLTIRSFHPENTAKFRRQLKACFQEIRYASRRNDSGLAGVVLDLRNNSGGHIAIMAEVLAYLTTTDVRLPYGVQVRHSPLAQEGLNSRFSLQALFARGYASNFKELNDTMRKTHAQEMSFVQFEAPINPRKRLCYDGPMVLLINGLSASASVSLASWFVRSGRGKTIGEPPMGSISGTFGNPIQLTMPTSRIQVNVSTARYYTQAPIRWESQPLLPDHPTSMTIQNYIDGRDPCLEKGIESLKETSKNSF